MDEFKVYTLEVEELTNLIPIQIEKCNKITVPISHFPFVKEINSDNGTFYLGMEQIYEYTKEASIPLNKFQSLKEKNPHHFLSKKLNLMKSFKFDIFENIAPIYKESMKSFLIIKDKEKKITCDNQGQITFGMMHYFNFSFVGLEMDYEGKPFVVPTYEKKVLKEKSDKFWAKSIMLA